MNNSGKQVLGLVVVFINNDYNPAKYLAVADGNTKANEMKLVWGVLY